MAVRILTPEEGALANRPNSKVMSSADLAELSLPTEKSKPRTRLQDYVLFIYGEKKIGKTSLAAMFPNALHLFFEAGGRGLSTYEMEVNQWEEFQRIVEMLASSDAAGHKFENIVVDTAAKAYDLCFDYVCRREVMSHPSDNNDFGKSWNLIKAEFAKQLDFLAKLGKGVILISHAEEAEIKTRNMGTWNKIVPKLPKQAVEFISASADLNAYYGYFGQNRYLVVTGSEYIEAGCRMKFNFKTPDGQRIVAIPMSDPDDRTFDEEGAYAALIAAFNNEQTDIHDVFAEDFDAARLTQRDAVLRPVSTRK